jgi:hypothetical protein
MTNLIHLIDSAIYLLPVIATIGFLMTVGLRSIRRFA